MVMTGDRGDRGLVCLTRCWGFKQTDLRGAVKRAGAEGEPCVAVDEGCDCCWTSQRREKPARCALEGTEAAWLRPVWG